MQLKVRISKKAIVSFRRHPTPKTEKPSGNAEQGDSELLAMGRLKRTCTINSVCGLVVLVNFAKGKEGGTGTGTGPTHWQYMRVGCDLSQRSKLKLKFKRTYSNEALRRASLSCIVGHGNLQNLLVTHPLLSPLQRPPTPRIPLRSHSLTRRNTITHRIRTPPSHC